MPPDQNEIPRRPDPDPTTLTTAQLIREVTMLREVIDVRFEGMDKAIILLQNLADRIPAAIQMAVVQLQNLHEEKFRTIAIQLSERDMRTEQTSRDSKIAIDAALQAAKETVSEQNKSSALAIAKSETATMKQIDQIGGLINTTNINLSDKIDDIKSRLTIIEGKSAGRGDAWGYIVGGVGVAAAILAIAAVVVG